MTRRARTAEAIGGVLVAMASVQFGIVVVLGKLAQRSPIAVFSMLAVRFAVAAVALVGLLVVMRQTVLAAPGERL